MGVCWGSATPEVQRAASVALERAQEDNLYAHRRVRELRAALAATEETLREKTELGMGDLLRSHPVPPEPPALLNRHMSERKLKQETEQLRDEASDLKLRYSFLNTAVMTLLFAPTSDDAREIRQMIKTEEIFQ